MDGLLDPVLVGVLGLVVGFAGGYAGIGGAPFLVACMVLFLGYDQHGAQGTVLAVMLGPMSLPGVIVMWDRIRLLKVEVILGVLAYAMFSNLGARLAYSFDASLLQLTFGFLLVVLGIKYISGARTALEVELVPDHVTMQGGYVSFSRLNIGCLAAGVGVVGGLFGIGAGVLMVPLSVVLFGLHKDDARALSLAILLPPVSVGAIVEYDAHGGIDWSGALVCLIAYMTTNFSGAKLGRKHDSSRFFQVMGGILLLLGGLDVAVSVASYLA